MGICCFQAGVTSPLRGTRRDPASQADEGVWVYEVPDHELPKWLQPKARGAGAGPRSSGANARGANARGGKGGLTTSQAEGGAGAGAEGDDTNGATASRPPASTTGGQGPKGPALAASQGGPLPVLAAVGRTAESMAWEQWALRQDGRVLAAFASGASAALGAHEGGLAAAQVCVRADVCAGHARVCGGGDGRVLQACGPEPGRGGA